MVKVRVLLPLLVVGASGWPAAFRRHRLLHRPHRRLPS